jgi:hypothetical protein
MLKARVFCCINALKQPFLFSPPFWDLLVLLTLNVPWARTSSDRGPLIIFKHPYQNVANERCQGKFLLENC